MTKKTPLHAAHVDLGARMIDFGGWDMPVQYSGIVPEAEATRQRVGLFDIGHMGRVELVGPQHVEAADWVMSCPIGTLSQGRVKYGFLLNERGTVIDDVLAYRDSYRTHLVVNAGNRDSDLVHIREQIEAKGFDARAIDAASPEDGDLGDLVLGAPQHMLALQGPKSEELLQRVVSTATDLSQLGYYRMTRSTVISIPALVSRTGYTGEDGFEVFYPAEHAEKMWDVLLSQGEDLGVAPIGLGARDALRTEAGMPLWGQEIGLDITPVEANLMFGVSKKKESFMGREALLAQQEKGVEKTLVGFEVNSRRSARHDHPIVHDGETVGIVTSGVPSPTLGKNIGMGFVPPRLAEIGSTFHIDVRGRHEPATVVPLPFYKRPR